MNHAQRLGRPGGRHRHRRARRGRTLLLCHLRGDPIGRSHDQPPNNGGNYFAFDAATRCVHHGWAAIDA
jgi:hypothetical protein